MHYIRIDYKRHSYMVVKDKDGKVVQRGNVCLSLPKGDSASVGDEDDKSSPHSFLILYGTSY